jgi:outer membrane receptor protein involved in Fe transport
MRFRMARLMALSAFVTMTLAFATPSAAQVFTGRIDATIADSTGAVLPGVTVDISGPQDQSVVSDARGEAHFLNLAPGTYTVSAKLTGFADYLNKNVIVVAGQSAPLTIKLGVAGVSTQVDVTAGTPVLDNKKTSTSTNISAAELQEVPSSRDPWVVLQTVPGVIVDRVNVGGAESGQQSNYVAKGAGGGENTWNMDGVAITDMAALGSSSTYYDFDMFQEMNVTTGGADLKAATPGVQMNMVLKSGSNTPRGSARVYFENEKMQSKNLPDDLKSTIGAATGGKGNRTSQYSDRGFEVGGPLFKDHLWAWGAIGNTDVRLLTLLNTPDKTLLKDYSFKATGQATKNVRGNFTYYRGAKLKYGRSAGADRPPETTWDQGGPTQVYKGEGNFVVGRNLFVAANVSHVKGGFFLTPEGGLDTPRYVDDGGVNHGSYQRYDTKRPQNAFQTDGNFFRGKHELKFGYGWRKADVDSSSIVSGKNSIITFWLGYPDIEADVVAWGHTTSTGSIYQNLYFGDTWSADRLTANLGIRFDRQSASVNGFTQPGNPVLPTLLPDLTSKSANDVVTWNSVAPRLGLTYALGSSRKTLARASYAMFASQMNATTAGFMSVVGYRGVYLYNVVDTNGNKVADPAEVQTALAPGLANLVAAGLANFSGFDLNNPGNVGTPSAKVGNYKTPLTHELQIGLDHELMPNFAVSGTYTYRRFVNFIRNDLGLTGGDYQQLGTFTGSHAPVGSFSVPYFGAIPSRIPSNRAATTYQSKPDYYQKYSGFEVAAVKRMSNRWMARFGFSTNSDTEHWTSPAGQTNPTQTLGNPNVNGGEIIRATGGSGKSSIYLVLPKYQFIFAGLYQGPWGLNFGANITSRQGYAEPYNWSPVATGDPLGGNKTLLLNSDVTAFRLPAATEFDARIGKEFKFGTSRTRINVDFDIFNLLNNNTVLGRQYNLRLSTADTVREIQNPRIARIGLRFNF